MATKEEILKAAKAYWEASTFPAYAGESCRSCPVARDGGCQDPHDDECPYFKAEFALMSILKDEGLIP